VVRLFHFESEHPLFKTIFKILMAVFALMIVGSIAMAVTGLAALISPPETKLSKKSIMVLELSGIIMDGREFIDTLVKYRKDDNVKGILIPINSPGGVVGPSQEIYMEIRRTITEFKKPVYAYCSGLCASGAYYSAVGADKIYTTPGSIMGSIGVIMDLVNLEKLYSWAKVERYAITTGPYKDAGAEYKPLTKDQRALFQDMLNKVLGQFKKAVSEGRKMEMAKLDGFADGRVWTGEDGVANGFADAVGDFEDAKRALGEAVGLGKDPELFKPKKRKGVMAYFDDAPEGSTFKGAIEQVLHADLRGKPLFVLPGAIGL
jgi:protease IV